ncbi:MAG: Mov34/MPN/PAD-1 family protein, partial [Methylophilaceae bacterium]
HPGDLSGPAWLELDPERCKKEVKAANAKGLLLIGFWHTHPELVPNLSLQDKKALLEFSKKNASTLPNPIAIIVGQSQEPDGIRAWSVQHKAFRLAGRRGLQKY